MRSSRLTAVLVVAAIATTTAGCGGGGDDDKADTSDTSAATDAPPATVTTPGTTTGSEATTATVPKGSTADPAPGRAVQEYFNALSKRDGKTACTYMNDEMKRAAIRIARAKATACPEALEQIVKPASAADLRKVRDVEILSSTVAGNTATVKVKRASRDAVLTKIGGRWIISGGIFR